jgi:hypothetical protein
VRKTHNWEHLERADVWENPLLFMEVVSNVPPQTITRKSTRFEPTDIVHKTDNTVLYKTEDKMSTEVFVPKTEEGGLRAD